MAGGSLLGTISTSYISNRVGRRGSLFIVGNIWLIGSNLICAVQNAPMLIVSRVLNCFTVGTLASQGPACVAEVSLPAVKRQLIHFNNGRLLVLF